MRCLGRRLHPRRSPKVSRSEQESIPTRQLEASRTLPRFLLSSAHPSHFSKAESSPFKFPGDRWGRLVAKDSPSIGTPDRDRPFLLGKPSSSPVRLLVTAGNIRNEERGKKFEDTFQQELFWLSVRPFGASWRNVRIQPLIPPIISSMPPTQNLRFDPHTTDRARCWPKGHPTVRQGRVLWLLHGNRSFLRDRGWLQGAYHKGVWKTEGTHKKANVSWCKRGMNDWNKSVRPTFDKCNHLKIYSKLWALLIGSHRLFNQSDKTN